MKTFVTTGLALLTAAAVAHAVPLFGNSPAASAAPESTEPVVTRPAPETRPEPVLIADDPDRVVQMAILLDTSSSMDGLIDQARTQLWKVVNELSRATRDGKRPRLEIGVYEYGNSGLPAGEGYLRQVLSFSSELDDVSEKLFSLTTNGGSEHVGEVIRAATGGLAWSDDPDDLKLIFVAGNEPFDQGPVSYAEAIADARARDITVHAIYCGHGENPEALGWSRGAELGAGSFLSIDHNLQVAHVAAPQDDEIARLGRELNDTYIAFGAGGSAAAKRQEAQDDNAGADEGAQVARSVSKANAYYVNSSWDLVDAVDQGTVKLEELPAEQLPAAMRKMKPDERRAHLEAQKERRAELQARINELNTEREAYVAAKRAETAEEGAESLDAAMIEAVRTQASGSGYTLK